MTTYATPANPPVAGSKNPLPTDVNATLPDRLAEHSGATGSKFVPYTYANGQLAPGFTAGRDPDMIARGGGNDREGEGTPGSLGLAAYGDLPKPSLTSATKTSADGGSFAANATYFYVITAVDASGESVVSNEHSAVVAAGTDSVTLVWVAVPGATGYNVYRGTAAGAENKRITTTGAVTTYKDLGAAGTTATPTGTITPVNVNAPGSKNLVVVDVNAPARTRDPETPTTSTGSNTPSWGGEGSPGGI